MASSPNFKKQMVKDNYEKFQQSLNLMYQLTTCKVSRFNLAAGMAVQVKGNNFRSHPKFAEFQTEAESLAARVEPIKYGFIYYFE